MYAQIKKEQQSKYDELITDCKLFFAFSQEQFEENKTELKPGENYIAIGAGGYMPSSYVKAYIEGSKEIEKWYKAELKKSIEITEQAILFELRNHECFYTGDYTSALYALPGISRKEVEKVFYKFREIEE